jgi:hypothetical protein
MGPCKQPAEWSPQGGSLSVNELASPERQNHSMTQTIRTVCDPNCNAKPRCGIDAIVVDEKILSVRPAEFPERLNMRSRICMMGMARLEYQYHPDRLLHPLRRTGQRGEGDGRKSAGKRRSICSLTNRNRLPIALGADPFSSLNIQARVGYWRKDPGRDMLP